MSGGSDGATGYGKPPAASRFTKGRSGNPKGRPKGSRRKIPYDRVLGQEVTIREHGIERKVSAAQAFILHLTRKGLEGDAGAARLAAAAIEAARTRRGDPDANSVTAIVIQPIEPGRVNSAMRRLGMARKLDPYRPTTRMVIEPWLVERALERLGSRRLSEDEQRIVVAATRTPHKVPWPSWWSVLPEGRE